MLVVRVAAWSQLGGWLSTASEQARRPRAPTLRAIREAHERMQRTVVLAERQLSEQFVKGRGPGGQKLNKTSSAVFLRDEATQLFVKTQATRDLQQNRKIARKLLQLRIDELLHGDDSVLALKRRKIQRNKERQLNRLRVIDDDLNDLNDLNDINEIKDDINDIKDDKE